MNYSTKIQSDSSLFSLPIDFSYESIFFIIFHISLDPTDFSNMLTDGPKLENLYKIWQKSDNGRISHKSSDDECLSNSTRENSISSPQASPYNKPIFDNTRFNENPFEIPAKRTVKLWENISVEASFIQNNQNIIRMIGPYIEKREKLNINGISQIIYENVVDEIFKNSSFFVNRY